MPTLLQTSPASRPRRCPALFPLLLLASLCSSLAAQTTTQQFIQPTVETTPGLVTNLSAGDFNNTGLSDLLYADAPVAAGGVSQISVGELLQLQSFGYQNLIGNRITFQNVSNVVSAVADFDGDGILDFAFATSPASLASTNPAQLCIYYGTGSGIIGKAYNPAKSGCMTFPIAPPVAPNALKLPNLSIVAAVPFTTGGVSSLVAVDNANRVLYTFTNSGKTNNGSSGILSTITLAATYALPTALSAGPIYFADLNGDGKTDVILNSQPPSGSAGHAAVVYLGNGDGTFQSPQIYTFDHNVWSMLLEDMDGDGHPDLIVEGDNGVIEIFHGNPNGTFATTSEGGTFALNGLSGNGGHLIGIADVNHDGILDLVTATPAGVSVLLGQGSGTGSLTYKLGGIYNAGPGHTAYAFADFNGDTLPDVAIDSPQGVAILYGNANGTFQTEPAYAAGAPALSGVLGKFRTIGNPKGNLDMAVDTAAVQSQLLTGNGDGTFSIFAAPTDTVANSSLGALDEFLWANLATGDFNGDGIPDLAYSLTGLPLPSPGYGTGLYVQYGNGDGTFAAPVALTPAVAGAPNTNTFYGESVAGDFNGDGIADIANIDALYDDTLLGQRTAGPFTAGFNQSDSNNTAYNQVAAGFFTVNRTSRQDLIFQEGANLIPYVNRGDGVDFNGMSPLANPASSTTWVAAAVLLVDMNGDGYGDVVALYHNRYATPSNPSTSNPNLLYVWYGNGDGTFSTPYTATLSRNYYLAAVADMNGDGMPDLVLSDGSLVGILYNLGNHTFGNELDLLAGQGIDSISLADLNGDGAIDIVATNGGPVNSNIFGDGAFNLPNPAVGYFPQSISSDVDVDTGGITVLLNFSHTRAVTGTLAASPEPSTLAAAFTLTATLVPVATGNATSATPTGTVQFYLDAAPLGAPVAVAPNGTATYAVPAGNVYTVGSHALSAVYTGDINYAAATFTGSHAIAAVTLVPTTTSLALCVGPSPACPANGVALPPYVASLTMYYGQIFNGDAVASAQDGSLLTGTIAFDDAYNGAAPATLCTLAVAVAAACPPAVGTTIGTSVGTNVFTAVYSGDATHQTSTSPSVTITVLPDTTSATLASSLNPSHVGQAVTFTATLTGNYAAPTGTVTFSELFPPTALVIQLGTATLVPGTGLSSTATFAISTLPVGTDTVVAGYGATQDFLAATSNTVSQVVLPVYTTTTTLTSSVNPSAVGQAVTFTATVAASGSASTVPTGIVTFLDGTATIGTGTLNASGVATFTTSTLALGSHNITASFPGDQNTQPSVSAVLVQIVASNAFTLTVNPANFTVAVGRSASLVVTVSASGLSPAVTLTCSNLPGESACVFGSTTIPAGGGSTTLILTTTAPHACGSSTPYFLGSTQPWPPAAPFAAPILAGLFVFGARGRPGVSRRPRKWLIALFAALTLAALIQTTGCGNCTDLGTLPNTYTFQVTATGSGTPAAVASQAVTVSVTP